eukprot:COSAG05_NODE_18231_length_311_cov_1.080189_1_plen_31_part_10
MSPGGVLRPMVAQHEEHDKACARRDKQDGLR